MNIEKLESVLDEMRQANFEDVTSAGILVRKWADKIGDAISEHLIAELGGATSPGESAAPDMAAEPSGHGWDESA